VEQQTHIIQFQDIGLATKLRGVVDMDPILDKRRIAAGIMRFTGIDRYLKEYATSAAEGFQCHRQDRIPHALEMTLQFLREYSTHRRLPPLSFKTA
jgi:hypothetical protein